MSPALSSAARHLPQMHFESLTKRIPDVVVPAPQRSDHSPVYYFVPFIKDYFHGLSYLRLAVRPREINHDHWRCAQLLSSELVRAYRGKHRAHSVVIPVARFVQESEGVISVTLVPTGIWRQETTQEGNVLLVLAYRPEGGAIEQGGHDVAEVAQQLKNIPKNEVDGVRKWLELLSKEYESPFAVGLLEDSIAVAVPSGHECFTIAGMELCPGPLKAAPLPNR